MDQQNISSISQSNQTAQPSAAEQLQQIVQSGENIQQEASYAQVAAAVEYAGFWARFAAAMIDGFIITIVSIIMNSIFPMPFWSLVLMWAYAIYMINSKQTTLGKMAVGMKVTAISGEKLKIGKVILRETVGKLLSAITLCIGYLMVAFTGKKQGLHDMIAGTVVVWDPVRKRRPWLVVLGIVFALIILVIVSIFIFDNHPKKSSAHAAALSTARSIIYPIITCFNDGGNINACYASDCSKIKLCSNDYYASGPVDITFTGWKFEIPAATSADSLNYTFRVTKPGEPDIVCGIADKNCK